MRLDKVSSAFFPRLANWGVASAPQMHTSEGAALPAHLRAWWPGWGEGEGRGAELASARWNLVLIWNSDILFIPGLIFFFGVNSDF